MPPCNCGKNKRAATSDRPQRPMTAGAARQQQYKLVIGGVSRTFGSRLEADAANARAGNRGLVRPT